MSKKISRREFVNTSAATAAGVAFFSVAAACEKGQEQPPAPAETEQKALDCTDVSGLTEAEKTTRQSLAYVDQSPNPAKLCANCNLFLPASDGGCGGCTVVKGPIHPNGYCNSWVQKAAG